MGILNVMLSKYLKGSYLHCRFMVKEQVKNTRIGHSITLLTSPTTGTDIHIVMHILTGTELLPSMHFIILMATTTGLQRRLFLMECSCVATFDMKKKLKTIFNCALNR